MKTTHADLKAKGQISHMLCVSYKPYYSFIIWLI